MWGKLSLKQGEAYVGFNGNGTGSNRRLRGRGYHLIGRTAQGWLRKAGYAIPEQDEERWPVVKAFLTDLQALSGPFGLIAGARHVEKQEWRSLDEMLALVGNADGRRWLKDCLLRVYTPADYLGRWRRYFAERLGFSTIPGGDADDLAEQHSEGLVTICSAADLQCWMQKNGLSDEQVAEKVESARTWVCKQRTGARTWSPKFAAAVTVLARQMALDAEKNETG